MKKKLNEAEYNLSITGLNTTDGDTLSQIVAMANQADNGGMGEVAPEAAPIDPYEDGMVDDTAIDTPFDTMEDDPTTDEMGYGVPVDEPEMNAYANPEMDTAVVPVDDMMDDDNDIMPDDFVNGEDEMEENNFNEEDPYTHPCAHEDSGNILTEDEGKSGYSVMVKDKEYARIDTDKEYSDDEIINQFLKQYMAKTGKEFPYIDQIVVQRNGGDVEEDVLLPKDDDNEFIPEEEDFMVEDDDFDMSDEQINEEIDNILWSAGMKGCSKKEEKGVNTKSLMEDDKVVDEAKATWKPSDEDPNVDSMAYLDDDVKQVYDLYKSGDYTPSEIFSMLKDAGLEYKRARQILQQWLCEKRLGESENPEMNLEDCDAPNPAEMNLDDKKKKLKEGFYVATNDDDYVQGGFESEDEAQEWIYNYCNDNMLNPEDYTVYEDEGSWEVDGFTYDTEREARNAYKQACECEPSEDHILMFDGNVINSFIAESAYEMNLGDKEQVDEALTQNIDMNAFLDKFNKEYDFLYKNRDRVAGYEEARDYFDEWVKKPESKEFMKKFFEIRGDIVSSDREAAAFAFALESFGLLESAYSPKLKDPNRKTPTRANYVDVNVNADAKSGTLGFEYPAPTNGKVSLSPKAGKIMETAKHLMSKAEGEKKDKLLSRYTFKLMNEGVSFSDAKRILSKF